MVSEADVRPIPNDPNLVIPSHGVNVVREIQARVPGLADPIRLQLVNDGAAIHVAVGPIPLDRGQEVIAFLTLAQMVIARYLKAKS